MTLSPRPSSEQNAVLRFHVACESTKPGQIVKIIGSIPLLGSWNIANALTMHTDEELWPIWKVGALVDL